VDAQLLFHVVTHGKADDFAIVAIQDGSDVEFSVRAWNLRDIGQPFLIGCLSGKIPANQVFCLLRRGVSCARRER
jgi:uncharacterized protein (DUF2062 family)